MDASPEQIIQLWLLFVQLLYLLCTCHILFHLNLLSPKIIILFESLILNNPQITKQINPFHTSILKGLFKILIGLGTHCIGQAFSTWLMEHIGIGIDNKELFIWHTKYLICNGHITLQALLLISKLEVRPLGFDQIILTGQQVHLWQVLGGVSGALLM